MQKERIVVKGIQVDESSRCFHYHSILDIVAIRFKCCNEYYSCIYCHEAKSNHQVIVWNKNEFDIRAILCGNCNTELTIREYLNSNNSCPFCNSSFNPKCVNHHMHYFE
ncbi:CHY zinc finger protein [Ferruginibacter paludis]|uniref:CHY zinc finger protein n=1 Tax=Ferruginibacter paludis TaxID=1310417 RepID=UPI00338F91A2